MRERIVIGMELEMILQNDSLKLLGELVPGAKREVHFPYLGPA